MRWCVGLDLNFFVRPCLQLTHQNKKSLRIKVGDRPCLQLTHTVRHLSLLVVVVASDSVAMDYPRFL